MSKCVLCKFEEKDSRYGEFIRTEDISLHEFCLYLSSALVQRGKDNNGLYGFLPKDIHAEAQRAKELICYYCHRPYASVGCCKSKCRRSFHMVCGIQNGCENQFSGTFQSYCHSHIHKHWNKKPPSNEQCCICYDDLMEHGKHNNKMDFIEAPCCKNGWFHKLCLQNFARTAGYFFKCPLCNNTKKFRSEMPFRGIFVPDRDAAWELEPNAYAELLERPKNCEAEICKHKNGRNAADDERNPLIFCGTCGAVAIHLLCLPKDTNSSYTCQDCLQIARPSMNGDSGHESLQDANDNDQNEEIDVCNICDSEEEEDDILETYLLPKKRPIIYDSSDSNENIKSQNQKNILITSQSHQLMIDDSTKNNNDDESSSDEDILSLRPSLSVKANKHKIIDSDESLEDVNFKNKKQKNCLIASTDDDSDETSGSSECPYIKRRKIFVSKSNQKVKDCSSQKEINFSKHSDLDSDKTKITDQKSLNTSCVANRTRRRKSIYYSNSLEIISESKHEDNHPTSSKRHSSMGSSSSSCGSFSKSLSNSVVSIVSSPTSSSLSSHSSVTTTTTASSEYSLRNKDLNVSCVANRTRRKSGQYTKFSTNLKREQSTESLSSLESDDYKITSKQHKIKDCESSRDNSPDISNKSFGLKRARSLRLISTTEDDDDDALKSR